MKKPTRRPRGFSLIELMLVVTIIAVMSSMAIPGYMDFMLRVRQSERKTAMANIAMSMRQMLSGDSNVSFAANAWNPPTPWSNAKKAFNPTLGEWERVDWQPTGHTYYHYYVQGNRSGSTGYFYVYAGRAETSGGGSYAYVYHHWVMQPDGSWNRVAEYTSPSTVPESRI